MTINTHQQSGVEVVEVTEDNGKDVQAKVQELAQKGIRKVVIDLSQVKFCSSLDIAQVINARADMEEIGGIVHVAEMRHSVRSIYRILKLERIFELEFSLKAAIAAAAEHAA